MDLLLTECETFVRKSISEEQEAIAAYLERQTRCESLLQQYKDSSVDETIIKKLEVLSYTFRDIIKEEEVHVGQLREMLNFLSVSNTQEEKGEEEAKEDIANIIGESFLDVAKRLAEHIQ